MKAIWYEKLGTASDVLQYGDMPHPEPAAGEVRVKIAVSGVNPIDVKRRQGGRGSMTSPRVVPHFDGAGTIDAIGEGVKQRSVGQRVWIYGAQWQRDFGTAAEFVTLPADLTRALPDNCSFAEGACLGIPALTAYRSVLVNGPVAGKTLLITGGAGAVGRYAIQFAKLSGASIISTVSSDEKVELATSAGADYVLNYRTENVADRIKHITAGEGVDQIVEVEFGGNLATSVDILKTGGSLVSYASQASPEPVLPFYEMMYKSLSVHLVLTFGTPAAALEESLAAINGWLVSGKLSHTIGCKFPLSETVAAHEAVEQGTLGKVLINVSEAVL